MRKNTCCHKNEGWQDHLEPEINRSLGTFLLEREFSDFDTFLSAFIQKLDDLDGRTEEEKSIDAALILLRVLLRRRSRKCFGFLRIKGAFTNKG